MPQTTTPFAKLKSFLARLLLLILIVSFGVWGIGDVVRGSGNNAVAYIGDNAISTQEFQQEWRQFHETMQGRIPPEMQDSPELKQQVLSRMVQQRLTVMAAKDTGLYASPEVVANLLRQDPLYQDIRGKFDAATYQRVLQANQISDAQFTQIMGDQSIAKLYAESINSPFIKASPALKALALSSEQETRTIELVEIPVGHVTTEANIDESVLQVEFERDKTTLYLTPETRSFEVAVIPATHVETLAAERISKKDIEDYRNVDPEAFKSLSNAEAEAKIRSELLPGKAEEVAHDLEISVEDAIASGDSLKGVLKTVKIDVPVKKISGASQATKEESGDDEFIAQAFRMEEDETSSLLTTAKGDYYVMHVTAVNAASPKQFAAVKDEVAARYRDKYQTQALDQFADKVKEKYSAANGVDARNAVLSEFGLTAQTLILARRTDRYKSIPPLLRYDVFRAKRGDVIGITVNPENGARQIAYLDTIDVPPADKLRNDQTIALQLQTLLSESLSQSVMRAIQEHHPVRIVPQKPTGSPS